MKETLENVRIHEEAAARRTKVFKRRVLQKQARKVRADRSSVKKNRVVLKRAKTRQNASWSLGGWHRKTKWQGSPIEGDAGALSSHDK